MVAGVTLSKMALMVACAMRTIGGETKIRNNTVVFINKQSSSPPIIDFYNLEGYSVTSGQPWEGVTVAPNHIEILVRAGRHNSEGPAEYFQSGLVPSNFLGLDAGSSPKKLNFAIKGVIKVTMGPDSTTCQDIRFGQGHTEATPLEPENNWWVGGSACERRDNPPIRYVVCKCDNGLDLLIGEPWILADAFHFKVSIGVV